MTPKHIPLEELLDQPESEWLDWKKDFPPGLVAGSPGDSRENGRAKVLRCIVSIANTVHEQLGYVVYGVDDSIRPRTVSGIAQSFDDANLQDWNGATFRPSVDFLYREVRYEGKTVGLVEVRPSSEYPHVCCRSLGGLLHEGQVWFRKGSRCTVAGHHELQRMFEPQEPLEISDGNGPIVREIRSMWEPLGWEPHGVKFEAKADYLKAGHRLAHLPGSRREIHLGRECVLLLRRKANR